MQMTGCQEHVHAQSSAATQRQEEQPSKYSPGVIAIAGYDPAVLAIWNLQVCTVLFCTSRLHVSCDLWSRFVLHACLVLTVLQIFVLYKLINRTTQQPDVH